jgi:hypothetical protein
MSRVGSDPLPIEKAVIGNQPAKEQKMVILAGRLIIDRDARASYLAG